MEVEVELLFFDTFSHDVNEELNLDLVQFPKPVYITEVRIIPLGARVQADFPGGVRLGATNPSQFHVDLFVNDLGKPGASTFENLGSFDYNQNDCINLILECKSHEENFRQIPTDGLVLRGWYTTITLAIYGTFTKQITEQIASPPAVVVVVAPPPVGTSAVPVQITTGEEIQIQQQQQQQPPSQIEWSPEIAVPVPTLEPYVQTQPELYPDNYENREYQQHEYYPGADVPKDPRTFTNVSSDWNQNTSGTESREAERDRSRERDWDRSERRSRRRSQSSERPESRPISRSRERSRAYSRSSSRDRDYSSRSKRDWSRSPEYRSCHTRRNRGSSYDRSRRDSSYEKSRDHDRRSPDSEEHRKRPRTPPINSPRRPRSPERRASSAGSEEDLRYRNKAEHYEKHHEKVQPIRVIDHSNEERPIKAGAQSPGITVEPPAESPAAIEEETLSTGEQFEPILSDEEIGDEIESQFELEYDTQDYEDVIKVFNPYTTELQKYQYKNEDGDIIPLVSDQLAIKEFDLIIKLLQKFNSRAYFFRYIEFETVSPETKECWVHFAEQLTQMLNQFNTFNKEKNELLFIKLIENETYLIILCDWIKIGLNFKLSMSQRQPGYKIRHIKAGVRLVETLCCYESFSQIILLNEKFNIFTNLYEMYGQTYMALSIKLMIIKSIHNALDTKTAMEMFLNNTNLNEINGYQLLLKILNDNPPTRIKFAIKSLIKKINLYETLKIIQDIVTKWFILNGDDNDDDDDDENINYLESDKILLKNCLNEIYSAYTWDEISYTQPKRFLPVTTKFEIIKDLQSIKSVIIGFHSHFKIHAFLESLLLIVTHQNLLTDNIIGVTFNILESICKTQNGLDYFIENIQTTNFLVKSLLFNSNFSQSTTTPTTTTTTGVAGIKDNENNLNELKQQNDLRQQQQQQQTTTEKSIKLGEQIFYQIQTKYYLDGIINLTKHNNVDQLIEHLHLFYSLSCCKLGKLYVVNTITIENNIIPLIQLIENERKLESNRQGSPAGIKYKSPILSYTIDLIDLVIRNCKNLQFLEEYGLILLDIVKNHEIFEPSVSAILQEMAVYLKPLEITNVFSYNDITQLCELIKRSIEFITTFPGDLIMGLRIIKHLGIPEYENKQTPEHLELKYKFIILEFYSADGITTIVTILDKLTSYFEQPGIHSATLASLQGVHAIQIILPAVQILQKMLTYVIQCRNTQFKDLTAVEPLLKTYILMHHVPITSSAYADAQETQQEIIKALLAYTQPSPLEGVDTESVHKSLWTQMIGEIIKYILSGPHTFIPGLLAFSELLPLPLPILTKEPITNLEISRLTTDRQLWSAHLHPQSTSISDMIQTICVSSYTQLNHLLMNVCLQLADLAPNMTLLVTKSIIDLILNEQISSTITIGANSQLTRLLKFLGNLIKHPSMKVSLLTILHGKFMDILSNILQSTSITQIHLKAEQNVHFFLQNLLNSNISMIPINTTGNREMALACSIPSKEILIIICNSVLENFTIDEIKMERLYATLKTMTLLTDHDITIYHLRAALENKKERFMKTVKRIVINFKEKQDNIELINILINFLFTLFNITKDEKEESQFPQRTIKLSVQQLINILSWNEESDEEIIHPLNILQTISKENLSEEENDEVKKNKINNEILEKLKLIIDYLEKETVNSISENSNNSSSDTTTTSAVTTPTTTTTTIEPFLPQAEGIVTQYASRPFYIISDGTDERLDINYWMNSTKIDESEIEHISCDLTEMIRTLLSSETNITSECKRLLHLSASPQATRERTTTAPCYRTRRVEVEPTTGRPEKKIFVTPMRGRGFARTPPSRGDLFRSRPPNTSRPPSLHVDDFLALETCGAQPTGPTGYNKLSREIISIRGGRGRGRGFASDRGRIPTVGAAVPSPVAYRQASNSPSAWPGHMSHVSVDPNMVPPQHFRTATSEPVVTSHFQNETHSHYGQNHFVGAPRSRSFIRSRPSRAFNR